MSILLTFHLDSSNFFQAEKELIHTSVLLPEGLVKSAFHLDIMLESVPIECYFEVLNHWQSGSVKWLQITLLIKKNQQFPTIHKEIVVNVVAGAFPHKQEPKRQEKPLKDGDLNVIDNQLSIDVLCNKLVMKGNWRLIDANNLAAEILDIETEYQLLPASNTANYAYKITSNAKLRVHHNRTINFQTQYLVFPSNELIIGSVKIHNPDAAVHIGGKWDLNDESSIHFTALSFDFEFSGVKDIEINVRDNETKLLSKKDNYILTQLSSGGENWQSPVHVDGTNKVPLDTPGYREVLNGNSLESEHRADPIININTHSGGAVIVPIHFWQKFPSQISVVNNSVSLVFFPRIKYLHELQGGETSTHEFIMDLCSTNSTRFTQLPPLSTFEEMQQPLGFGINKSSYLSEIISNAIEGPNNFYLKREKLDEYGWRNFGELYADHETAGYTGNEIFVSHYNNQYDPIYGFLKQYLISGDSRWFELAEDLVKHVKDIDIYQTTKDKPEYNGGLFWHTDHYLKGYTSTHRSYSKYHDSNAYQDHAGGGGPGGQHCYTAGLTLHYLLTGSESSKQAALILTSWISKFYEGSNTCIELLLAIKNRHLTDVKNHFSGQYPLDRGTANYVNALLDSFELTQDRTYLTQIEHIISYTVHPNEDVNLRHLEDVENTWFYTVFLQAVCRYLLVKQQLLELDISFYYARDCLLKFANWMVEHEYMYLDKPSILEYPNDTWTAQDLRKASIFAAADYFSLQKMQIYLDKAEYFESQVASRLNSSTSKTYTRIMALVLQNCGLTDYYKNIPKIAELKPYSDTWPAPLYTGRSLLTSFFSIMLKRLGSLSLKNEINWLKKRLT